MNRRFFAFLVISVIFVLFSCGQKKLQTKDLIIKKSSGESVVVKAELAITDEEQTYGFMNRKNIPDGTGMLFIFKDDRIASFWMKNTPTPLSIAYIDYAGKIKDIFDMTPFSLASIVSTGYVRYALEVPQGWFEKEGIKVGDYLDLSNLKN
jgi:uncharacterized membrane protein (UPF0127 family)